MAVPTALQSEISESAPQQSSDAAECRRIADEFKMKAENAGPPESQSYFEINRQWLLVADARERDPVAKPLRRKGRRSRGEPDLT